MSDRPRLAILRALGLGDLLTAVPALRGLAAAFPDHRRLLLAPAALAPLLPAIRTADGRPAVDRLVPVAALGDLPRTLDRIDVAVNLHGRGPQSHRALLARRPGRLLAFGYGTLAAGPRWAPGEHEVRRWCRMLADHGVAADPADLDIAAPAHPPATAAHGVAADPADLDIAAPACAPAAAVHGVVADSADLDVAAPARAPAAAAARGVAASPADLDVVAPARGATLLHPGAAAPARRWPAARWAAIARAERAAGHAVAITGSGAERGLALAIARDADLPPTAVLAGRTHLPALVAAVAAAERVVCGDTGVAHLATALRRPSVVLFGPVAPAEWGPPPDRPWHRALWAGRRGDPHGDRSDPGLLRIAVDDVLAALAALPAAPAPAAPARPGRDRGPALTAAP